ncbi:MAG: efflux RND transporter periplasmic adaptor subunit [Bacteroidota bacterium]
MKNIPILFLLALVIACGDKQPQAETNTKADEAIVVSTAKVESSLEADAVVGTGRLAAQEEVRLSFKIGGIIKGVYTEEGRNVRKGQVLARLDATEINAQVLQATEAVRKAERDLERVQKLYTDSVTTLENVQDLTTAKAVAEANLEIARFNQQHAVIYAPTSGKVLKRFAEQGELIGPGSPILYIASTQGTQVVKVGLADKDVVRLKKGDKAEAVFDVWPEQAFPARVSEIAAGADPMSGTYEVELALTKVPAALKNGFVANVSIYPSEQQEMRQIPLGALVEAGPEYAAFYIPTDDGKSVKLHTIKHYEIHDEWLSVAASEWGEPTEVVTRGAKYLRPEQAITIATPKPMEPADALTTNN